MFSPAVSTVGFFSGCACMHVRLNMVIHSNIHTIYRNS